jgi:hypothetical protein
MRVWLHECLGNEVGWNAWCLDLLGFGTWAPSEREALDRLPRKLEEHLDFLAAHGFPRPKWSPEVQVVERVSGDEILFSLDKCAVSPEQVDLTAQLLAASRSDLLATVGKLPEAVLDWDPPYRSFLPWATWRTVRQILAHLANTETHYYLAWIGFVPRTSPAPADGDWQAFLAEHRSETLSRLRELRDDSDRRRVVNRDGEEWSAAKVLRRLVRHEILHTRSIARIGREYAAHVDRPEAR